MLSGKKVLIGITGSIAAYKIILLTRLLVKENAEVKIIITKAAKDFISPLVLSTLSKNKVNEDLSDGNEWTNHVMLGRWADVFLIAPLSCNSLAKMANGLCDNLLLATYLSATCPVVVAPAMDEDMWNHTTTQRNLAQLNQDNIIVIPPAKGELASGLYGDGRMAEPEYILQFLKENFFRSTALKGKKVLVTAGPTFEPIDPVRFIGNRSSGKMGFAIAHALYENGADVILISGPCNQVTYYNGIKLVKIETAEEMFNECILHSKSADIIVMNAAVADFTSDTVAAQKIKKSGIKMNIQLQKTKDILQWMGDHKTEQQFLMGFALETENEEMNAKEKLLRKKLDVIVLNSLNDAGAGFNFDTNTITIIDKEGSYRFPSERKVKVAANIVNWLIQKTTL